MSEVAWEAPGPGVWELETVHAQRPATKVVQTAWRNGLAKGFKYGTARYGAMLDYLQPEAVNSFMYMQARPFGAPPGAAGPPPPPVLWLLTRLHPKMRARTRQAKKAFDEKLWREDLKEWDTVDRPDIVAKHRAIEAVDVEFLADEQLAAHLKTAYDHLEYSHWIHHKYTAPATLVVGDLLAGVMEWTGLEGGEILTLIRGNSQVTLGFAAAELGGVADAIRSSPEAKDILADSGDSQAILDKLAGHPEVGPAVRAYVKAIRFRGMGYDVCDKNAGEMPESLVGAMRSALSGAASSPPDTTGEKRIRDLVPDEHKADFDDRLAEARLMSRLRDERGVYSDGWATGLMRRALLEAGRRLSGRGRLHEAEHAVELSVDEAGALLRGGESPTADEVAERFVWRSTHTTDDAPEYLGGEPAGPPDPAILPPAVRRTERAMGAMLNTLFAPSDRAADETTVRGIAVHPGTYEGPARIIHNSSEFDRIQPGDVLIARSTSPYFNVVLPMLGAIVTDRGGALSHAAIVSREYGIPGVVGTREATARIPDGARVRVDGTTGEVTVIA
ncbi:MAG TPA: PEP-utilizing enzyme [Aeromicrobium sp.]|nr:PEP-utilizing enzyme [Aeromicrobium sp.]HKY56684.1 PEP-utilizing enzyme [Aeromicrobium sp.]